MIFRKAYGWFASACLFVIPLVYFPIITHAFVQGKELTFKTLMIIGVIGCSLLFTVQKKLFINEFWKSRLTKLLGLFFLIYFASTLFSPNPLIALYGSYSRGFGFIVMIFMAIWFVLNAAFSERKIIEKILAYSYLSALIVAGYALSQTLGFDPFFENFKNFLGRSFGFIGNPSLLGQFLALEFVIGLYFFVETKKLLKKSVVAFSLLIIIAGLLVSETRAAVLALLVGIILLAIRYYLRAPAEKKGKIIIPNIIADRILKDPSLLERYKQEKKSQ